MTADALAAAVAVIAAVVKAETLAGLAACSAVIAIPGAVIIPSSAGPAAVTAAFLGGAPAIVCGEDLPAQIKTLIEQFT